MLQYLIILLDDASVSYCHYENEKTGRNLISIDDLKAGIIFAMKQNLMIQFIYPVDELPETYKTIIDSIDHHNIMPVFSVTDDADVIVFDNWDDVSGSIFSQEKEISYIWRTGKDGLFSGYEKLISSLQHVSRLNIVLTDVDTLRKEDFEVYNQVLLSLKNAIKEQYAEGLQPQLNILTDRIMLDAMNNCNAGVENITLAPNGKFYICPAFYLENESDAVGDLVNGIDVTNRQLYRIDCAPLCRICDAYQCKRCVWLNRKTTLEVNTPSHEQCVTAHLERNASRELLQDLQVTGRFTDRKIKKINYLDPFDIKEQW